MAGGDNTIKEFLVALGFVTDESSFAKFVGATEKAAIPVMKLGAAVVATAAAVELMVERIAREMQDLYYSAQRTGVAAQTLQAVGYAAKQIGLDASEGTQLMEGFSRAMRLNPGAQALLAQLGGEFQHVNGVVGLTQQGLFNVLERLKTMPPYVRALYAPLLGVSEETLNKILTGNNLQVFEARTKAAAQMAHDFGLNLQDASEKGNTFSQHIDTLAQAFEDLSIKAGVDWMPIADKVIQGVTRGTVEFGKWIAQGHETILMVGSLAAAVGGLSAALKIMSALPTLGWLSGLAGLLMRVSALALAVYTLYETVKPSPTNEGEQDYMKTHPGKYKAAPSFKTRAEAEAYVKAHPETYGGVSAKDPASLINFFQKNGWTKEQAAGIVANLQAESGLNPNARGDHGAAYGIAQWHIDRQEALAKFAAKNRMDPHTLDTQLRFVQNELMTSEKGAGSMLSKAKTAREAAEAVSLYYERPAGGYAEATKRGERAAQLTMTQNTQITVNGVRDADKAAQKVREAQAGVNDALARNFIPAVQ